MAVMLGVTGDQTTVFDDDSLGNPGCRVRLRRGGLVWPGRPRDDGQPTDGSSSSQLSDQLAAAHTGEFSRGTCSVAR